MAVFIVILGSSLVSIAEAETSHPLLTTDAKAGLYGRTYPVGVQAVGTVGLDYLLWGNSAQWKYGYLRGAFNLATSAVVNRVGFELQAFPISILGLSAGYDWGWRNFTPKYLDCNTFDCLGRVDRFYTKLSAVGAYHGWILSLNARYENLHSFESAKPFFDEVTLLVGRSSGENVLTYNPALLYTLNEDWKVGVTSLYSRALDTGDFTHLYGPIATYTWDTVYQVLAGVGLNRSPVVHSGVTAFFMFQYNLQSSLSIADLGARIRK